MKHAPMKPFYAFVKNETGEIDDYSRSEGRLMEDFPKALAAGTHRIVRCVEDGAQGELREIGDAQPGKMYHDQFGNLWRLECDYTSGTSPTWRWSKMPPIPQPELAPDVVHSETFQVPCWLAKELLRYMDKARVGKNSFIPIGSINAFREIIETNNKSEFKPAPVSPDLVGELWALREFVQNFIGDADVVDRIDAILAKAGV